MRSLFFITYFIYVILRSKKSMHMLQQNFYNNSNRYIKWIFNNLEKSILTIDWLFLVLVILGLLGVNVELLFFLFYLGITLHYYNNRKKEQVKIKFKFMAKKMIITCRCLIIMKMLFIMN